MTYSLQKALKILEEIIETHKAIYLSDHGKQARMTELALQAIAEYNASSTTTRGIT